MLVWEHWHPELSVIVSRMHKNASRACIADKIRESLPPDLSWRFASATPFWAIEQAAKSFDRRAIKAVPRRIPNHRGWVAILMGDCFRHDPQVGTGANLGM